MRYIELLLKLAFFALAAIVFIVQTPVSIWFSIFLLVGLALGLVLILNRKSSYTFKHKKSDYVMRRIEGVLLVLMVIVFVMLLKNAY